MDRSIVCGVDGSPDSQAALAVAIDLATRLQLRLIIANVVVFVLQIFITRDVPFEVPAFDAIERDFPVILLMPPGRTFRDLARLAERLDELRAETLVFSSEGARLPRATRSVRVPGEIPEIYSPIPYIIPGQLFAASLAEVKGLDPDKPRSLQIVTRTV